MTGDGQTGRRNVPQVVIDVFPAAALRYRGYAVLVVDVFRATTTAVTAVATGRRCLAAPTVDEASVIAAEFEDPLLAGEVGGNMPYGYEMNNSPAEMAERSDVHRPAVLVSSSGTLLMHNAARSGYGFAVCLRNLSATVEALAHRYPRIAVVGAGSRGEFREEDQMCCALVADELMGRGYMPGDDRTVRLVRRWSDAPPDAWLESNSVDYLVSTGQERDVEFVRGHIDDLDRAHRITGREIHVWDGRKTEAERAEEAAAWKEGMSGSRGTGR